MPPPRTDGKAIKHGYIHQWDSSDSDGDEDFTARGGADTTKSEGSGASSVTESACVGSLVYTPAPIASINLTLAHGVPAASRFLPRQFKATWQVIADQHSSYSYHMYSIPRVRSRARQPWPTAKPRSTHRL